MSQAPCMPLWTDVVLADMTHLSTEQFGSVMLILTATWRNDARPFPDDDELIGRICRMTAARFRSKIRPVISAIFDLSGGTWRQKRLESEWEKVAERREKASQKARAAANAKYLKYKRTDAASSSPQADLGESLSFNHKPMNYKEEREETPSNVISLPEREVYGNPPSTPPMRRSQTERSAAPDGDEDAGFDQFWKIYPRHEAKQKARQAYVRARRTADAGVILDGAKRYAGARKRDIEAGYSEPRFTKHPATWLNGGCWEDEIPAKTREQEEEDRLYLGIL